MVRMDSEVWELWGDPLSGNCWKPAWMLQQTGRNWRWHTAGVLSGATRTPEFLAMNPNGKVPLLRFPDGRFLSESNAMLLLLAEGTPLLPQDVYQRALVHQWLFWEQYSHEPYIAVARFLRHFEHGQALDPQRMAMLDQRGHQALAVMEQVLAERPYFAGEAFTVADIALYAYTHVGGEGGFDIGAYPAVNAWLERVAARPGHFDLEGLRAYL